MANLKTFSQSALLFVTAQAFTMAGLAQSQPLVASVGYAPPAIFLVPGQIVTLYVEGLNLAGQTFTASSIPLPTTLGGITVNLSADGLPKIPPVPLLSVVATLGLSYTAITIEVPNEVYDGIAVGGRLSIAQNGISGPSIDVAFIEANAFIIKQCAGAVTQPPGGGPEFQFCTLTAQHADGSPVTSSAPANPGEEIVLYAFGLGRTTPAVPDGFAATQPTPTVQSVFLDLNFSPNADPITSPRATTSYPTDYTGLTPGYVGLYQINFTVPTVIPRGVPLCSSMSTPVNTNLTITVYDFTSLDGGGICVATPQ